MLITPPENSLDQEEDLLFADEHFEETVIAETWKVMIVDDEEDIHRITRFVLSDYIYQGKRLEFIHAHSAIEAKPLCQQHPNIAVMFLDVVMETTDAGLRLVEYVRDTLQNRLVRIILRTGQPGCAPETEVILKYDINDYVNKTELTDQRLFTLITTSLRAYSEMLTIEQNRQALVAQEAKRRELIVELSQLNQAYERFVPRQLLSFLDKKSILEVSLGDQIEKEMTLLFSNIRSYTPFSETLGAQDNVEFLNNYFGQMEEIVNTYHGFVEKYLGDAILAIFPFRAEEAIGSAITMLNTLTKYNQLLERAGLQPIQVGIGIDTDKLVLGAVGGHQRMDGTVIAEAVNLASQTEALTKLHEIPLLITQHTYTKLTDVSRYHLRLIDYLKMKGKLEKVAIYEVFESDPEDLMALKQNTLSLFEQAVVAYHQGEIETAREKFAQVLHLSPTDSVARRYWERCHRR